MALGDSIFTTDHRRIGARVLILGIGTMLFGGGLAMALRWQLGWPGAMAADTYAATLTAHGTIMIFFGIIPILTGGLGTAMLPRTIGADEMAYPRLSRLSFWGLLPALACFSCAFHVRTPAISGWTAYAPLASIRGGETAWTAWMYGVNFAAWAGMWLATLAKRDSLQTANCRLKNATLKFSFFIFQSAIALVLAAGSTWLLSRVVVSGQSAWFASLALLTIPSLASAINLIGTVALCRGPGVRMMQMPLAAWNWLITGVMVLLATPALLAALVMAMMDHHVVAVGESVYRVSSFFNPAAWAPTNQPQLAAGGAALLWQHLFWFYAHPAVYIMILPAMGMVSDIIATNAGRPVFGYRAMVGATVAIAGLGFVVWAHHMFQSGMNPLLGTAFSVASMVIAVPSGVKVFNWLATLHGGSIRFTVPMCHACAFVAMFVIGGMSGIYIASTAVNVHLHDTYFIVAHLHYVLFGGSLFGIFAGVTHYFPQIFGREMNRTLGYVHFVLTFILFNCTFFVMHLMGLSGAPRRVADPTSYDLYAPLLGLNQFVSLSAFLLGAVQLIFVANFVWGGRWSKRTVGH
jgi:cytochrome c oxidase subunit 1